MAEVQFIAGPVQSKETPAEYKTRVDAALAAIGAGVNVDLIPTQGGTILLYGSGVAGGVASGSKRTEVNDVAYQALVTDVLIAYIALTAARIVTLPDVADTGATATNVFVLTVKDEAGAATGAETITLQGDANIDGAATLVINLDYGFATLYCDGTEWFSLASRLA